MMKILVPALFAMLGLGTIVQWFRIEPTIASEIVQMIPGMEGTANVSKVAPIPIGNIFQTGQGKPSEAVQTWPRFRGVNYDNIVENSPRLLEDWSQGVTIRWEKKLGEGHSGPAIANGCVYILDYDEMEKADMLHCYSLNTGEQIWSRGYRVNLKRNHGFSRTVPAIEGNYLVTIGPKCQVMCVHPKTGQLHWGVDLVAEWQVEVPLWYTGQCPIIVENYVLLATGSDQALILALDCATGKTLWTIPNPQHWKMSHSSIIPFYYQEKKYFVYCSLGGITIFNIRGEVITQLNLALTPWNPQVIAPSPLILPDGKIWLTAGYGAGSMLVQFSPSHASSTTFSLQILQTLATNEGLASEQQTPIFHQGYIYAILPKDAGEHRGRLVCCDPNNGKNLLWTSGKTQRFGLGPYLVIGDKLIFLHDDGTLFMAKASPENYTLLTKYKILHGHDAWGPMAFSDGRLLLRDSETLICLDIRK